ncbi:MAG: ABC transporter substrate-binding protein [Thiobacillus sp.]|nr:ABC transporter substrate-binding protein [Thiobacillus sp.]
MKQFLATRRSAARYGWQCWLILALAGCLLGVSSGLASARVLRDMAGEAVAVSDRVERVATLGAVPVINSLLFAVGAGDRIANGLADFANGPRYGYQKVFAPQTASLPSLQNLDRSPDLEALLAVRADVVLTMDRATARTVQKAGLPALYLAWRQPEDVKAAVRLLGDLLHREQAAARYVAYFDTTQARVAAALRGPATARPRVLYFNPKTLTQPHLIVEWWIRSAGGESVTDDGRTVESRGFNLEQLLAWDPDILIVTSREDVAAVQGEPRLRALKAVRAGRILVIPFGAHIWGNRTAEQPLTLLWAAKHFHPELFKDMDLVAETQAFYRDLFGTVLSAAQVREILDGGPPMASAPR